MNDIMQKIRRKILQHKFAAIFLFAFVFCVLEIITYIHDPHNSIYVKILKKTSFASALENSRSFYEGYEVSLQTDEYIMLTWLWPDIAGESRRVYKKDLFYRLLSDELRVEDVGIRRRVDTKEELAEFVEFFGTKEFLYDFDNVSVDTLTDPVDDIILKALYCDVSDYDQFDLDLLGVIQDYEGGYGDTHYLLGLLFLERFGCILPNEIADKKARVVDRILNAQKIDDEFSDLFSERVVLLYWSGFGDLIRASWIKKIIDVQDGSGGWSDIGSIESDPHATGLSALSIKYFIDGRSWQNVLVR